MADSSLIALIQQYVAKAASAFGWGNELPLPGAGVQTSDQESLQLVEAIRQRTIEADQYPLLVTWAAMDGHAEILRALLAAGADPDAPAMPHSKYRPVLLAARAGHLEAVRLLAEAKANIGFGVDVTGRLNALWSLPLAQAIMGRHSDVAMYLAGTKAGIVPVSRDAAGLIGMAAEHGVDGVIPLLVAAGYSTNPAEFGQELTPLMRAAARGHTAAVKALLDAGADVNAPVNADPGLAKYSATSALLLAAKAGHREVVEALLQAGADPAATDYRGATAYDWAKRNRHAETVALLKRHTPSARSPFDQLMDAIESNDLPAFLRALAAGCDIEAKTPVCWPDDAPVTGGQTPLMRAAELGRIEMIKALLDAGADPTALSDPTEDAEITAIHYAARAGQRDAIRVLMAALPAKQRKTDLGVTGCTPLQIATEKGQLQAMQTLLESGADLSGKTGGSCLYKAVMHGHEAILRFLLKQGISPDDSGQYRSPPIIKAVQEKREPMVRLLLEAGVNVNVLCKDGWTALRYAEYNGLESIAELLRKAGGKLPEDLPAKPAKTRSKPAEALPKLPKRYATGKMADRPKFRITPKLQSAARKLEAATGLKREERDEHPGVLLFTASCKDAVDIVRKHQEKMLDAGCYLFAATHNLTGSETLVLAPTTDLYEAIAWAGTHGPNDGIGSENIIDCLGDIADDNPFTLWTITHDCIEGRFEGKLSSPKAVANLFGGLCPDTIAQGTGTVSALANALRGRNPRLFLWWD